MRKALINAAVFAAVLLAACIANADMPPFPPNVIVNGVLLNGTGGGGYSTSDSNAASNSGLSIDGSGNVSLAINSGTYQSPYIVTPGYSVSGYDIPGYYIPGYWTTGYWSDGSMSGGSYDDSGTWISTGDWVPAVWVPDQWVMDVFVPGYWVPDVWSPGGLTWTTASDSGTYAHFAFQMQGNDNVQPADSNGNAWSTNPRSNIPAVQVNTTLYHFNAADTAGGYDYYSDPASSGYLWITPGYYGGYDAASNASFSGTNSNGFFRDYNGSGVQLVMRNGDGSFLSLGYPNYGPPQIWSNGLTFRFLTEDNSNGADIYLAEGDGYVFVTNNGGVSGMVNGSYQNPVLRGTPDGSFAANFDGALLPAGSQPASGPPAINISGDLWTYRGSTSMADYYGGPREGEVLSIAPDGTVTYSDRSTGTYHAAGSYAGGAFQNLPTALRGANTDGSGWTTLPANSTYPAAVAVNGQTWYYSSTLSGPGFATYLDPLSRKTLYVSGANAVISDPAAGTYVSGSYASGQFSFGSQNVSAVNPDGSPLSPVSPNNVQLIPGDLDIAGNLTLGSWTNTGGQTVNGFALSFGTRSQESLLRFDATRFATNWLWTRVVAPGSTQPLDAMRLDANNVLTLYTPDETPAASIVLDPVSGSSFRGPLRVLPQGDMSMGAFTNGPAPR